MNNKSGNEEWPVTIPERLRATASINFLVVFAWSVAFGLLWLIGGKKPWDSTLLVIAFIASLVGSWVIFDPKQR